MSSKLRHYNVRLTPDQWARLTRLADDRQQTPAKLVRDAVDAFLGANDLLSASQRRLARISEFQQIALDIIIREQYPEYRDRIIAEAHKRLEQYHGA